MPHRPFTPRQRAENAAFLEALRRTGNARLAASELGVHRSTYTKRRAKDAAFAQAWEMNLAAAHAAFHLAGGPRLPEPVIASGAKQSRRGHNGGSGLDRRVAGAPRDDGWVLRTEGGEPVVVRLKNGRLQMRLALPGRMTKAAEQLFFRALSASANIRLSAAAAGFAASSFYWRKNRRRAFAHEMRLALEMSCDRLEMALHASTLAAWEGEEDAGWRHNDPPPIPPMSVDQAIQLLCLHEKSVRQSWDRPHRRKRRGEPWETYTERLRAMWTFEKAREAEDAERRLAALRRADRYEATGDWRFEEEAPPPELPPLHLVTGWSKADPKKKPHNPDLALFGGWRLSDWEKRKKAGK